MEVRCNWTPENNQELDDIIQESSKFPEGELEELLDENKCLSLTRPTGGNTEDDCCIKLASCVQNRPPISWPPQIESKRGKVKNIMGFLIISEARIVEVCSGPHQEYLKTVHGELVGDFGDSRMYKCEIKMDKPKEAVWVKLKASCHVDSIWIYGFHIVTTDIEDVGRESRFGSANLSSVLQDKDIRMSKGAAKFRSLLETYNGTNNQLNEVNGNNPMSLMSMLMGPMMGGRSFPSTMNVHGRNEVPGEKKGLKDFSHEGDGDNSEVNCNEFAEENMKEYNGGLKYKHNTQLNSYRTDDVSAYGNLGSSFEKMSIRNGTEICRETGKDSIRTCNSDKSIMSVDGNFVEKMLSLMGEDSSSHMKESLGPLFEMASNFKEPIQPKSFSTTDHLLRGNPEFSIPPKSRYSLHKKSYPGNMAAQQDNTDPAMERIARKESEDVQEPCTCGRTNLSTNNGDILNSLENMIDKKFAYMEERLLQKVEEKLSAKAQEDSLRLEMIEHLLSKINEKL